MWRVRTVEEFSPKENIKSHGIVTPELCGDALKLGLDARVCRYVRMKNNAISTGCAPPTKVNPGRERARMALLNCASLIARHPTAKKICCMMDARVLSDVKQECNVTSVHHNISNSLEDFMILIRHTAQLFTKGYQQPY